MLHVTGIEAEKRRKGHFRVELEDGSALVVPEEVLFSRRIETGSQVSFEELAELARQADFTDAYNSALRYLGYRARSCHELIIYLSRKGYSRDITDKVLNRLSEYGLADDRDFAERLIRSKRQGSPAGKLLLAQELGRKGIDQDIIRDVMDDISEEDEIEQAARLAEKIRSRCRQKEPKVLRVKIWQALARRGFDWDTASRAINRLALDDPED